MSLTTPEPLRDLWVATTGSDAGDGSVDHPFLTIQAAVNAATPGTAVMVEAGLYTENVRLPNTGGTPDAPIQLLSADGAGAATIVGANAADAVIKGLGTDNVVVRGFTVEGGTNGIQFSANGVEFTNLVSNVVVADNVVTGSSQDGIKLDQADHATVWGNTVSYVGGQAVDFLAVDHATIAWNDLSHTGDTAAVFVKGGSTDVLVQGNHIHDTTTDGLSVGGYTSAEYFRPGQSDYEAADVRVVGNDIEIAGKRAIDVLGAQGVAIKDDALASAGPVISISFADPGEEYRSDSSQLVIAGDTFFRPTNDISNLYPTQASVHDLRTDGVWAGAAGPGAQPDATVAFSPADPPPAASDPVSVGALTLDLSGAAQAPVLDFRDPTAVETLPDGRAVTGVTSLDYLGSAGDDAVFGTAASDTLAGGAGHNALFGGGGADTLVGDTGDVLFGGAGDDLIFTTGTADYVNGGSNYDTLVFEGVAAPGPGDVRLVEYFEIADGTRLDLTAFHEGITLTPWGVDAHGVTVTGSTFADHLVGGAAADTLSGGAGNDTLDGGGGGDRLAGGVGDDTYVVDDARDMVIENPGEGHDTVHTTLALYRLGPNLEDLHYDGAGTFTGYGTADANAIWADGATAATLHGGDGADTLYGGAGNDSLYGDGGPDVVYGGAGDDYIKTLAGEGPDTIDGGDGDNLLTLERITPLNLTLDLTIAGPQALGDGTVISNIEQVRFTAGSGDDFARGGDLADVLKGGAGDDTLIGGGGDDVLQGGAGHDSLTGGDGADTFRFDAPVAGSDDVLTDFTSGTDHVALSAAGFGLASLSQLDIVLGVDGTGAYEAKATLLVDPVNHTLSFDADGVGPDAAVLLAYGDFTTAASDYVLF